MWCQNTDVIGVGERCPSCDDFEGHRLVDEFQQIPEPPCTGCSNFAACRDTRPEIACADFAEYVDPTLREKAPRVLTSMGPKRKPLPWIFAHVFNRNAE